MRFTADRLILFGATGDLAQRMLLPSLCALHDEGLLPDDLRVVGTARSHLDDEGFRAFAKEAVEKYLPAERRKELERFLERLFYQSVDATKLDGFKALAAKADRVAEWNKILAA